MRAIWAVTTLAVTAGQAAVTVGAQTTETAIHGYLETNYSLNFNRPANRITAARGFDDRHNQLQLSNLAFEVTSVWSRVTFHTVLQAGETANVYYAAEPSSARNRWRHLQQATIAVQPSRKNDWRVEAGLFLSPIGPEGVAIKDNWNWSHSNLFYALPTYHLGVSTTYSAGQNHEVTVAVYNGWNNIEDNNKRPSVAARWQTHYGQTLKTSVLYFGGVERSTDAVEGQPRRDLLDLWAQWDCSDRLALLVHGDIGQEHNRFGTSAWSAAAVTARGRLADHWYLAARVDRFVERVPAGASPIFWSLTSSSGRRLVRSKTLTLEYRATKAILTRLELRHDSASASLYYRGETNDPNSRSQTTLTLGAVAWF
ncbi:MAG: outer membrane beta-barrel protein [Acidobacteriota bacterium]